VHNALLPYIPPASFVIIVDELSINGNVTVLPEYAQKFKLLSHTTVEVAKALLLGVRVAADDSVAGKILSYTMNDFHPVLATKLPVFPGDLTTSAVGIEKQFAQVTSNTSCESSPIFWQGVFTLIPPHCGFAQQRVIQAEIVWLPVLTIGRFQYTAP
jgi:hypothetical protein